MNTNLKWLSIVSITLLFSCRNSNTQPGADSKAVGLQVNEEMVDQIEPDYIAIGKKMAIETKSVLAKYLMGAIAKEGAEYAVNFCNTKALVITDSMARIQNARIKRVSDKPRNAANTANESEQVYIELLKNKIAAGEVLDPKLSEIDGKMVGYYPIVTNDLCLQCHGIKNKDILPETLKKIHKLYPDDKATGYKVNEIRGIFVVEMDKK